MQRRRAAKHRWKVVARGALDQAVGVQVIIGILQGLVCEFEVAFDLIAHGEAFGVFQFDGERAFIAVLIHGGFD